MWHKMSVKICKVFYTRQEYKHMNVILENLKFTIVENGERNMVRSN